MSVTGREVWDHATSQTNTLRLMDNDSSVEDTSRISQAQGMVIEQVGCTVDDALVLLNERAKVTGLRLEEVAIAVVDRRTQFRHHATGPAPP